MYYPGILLLLDAHQDALCLLNIPYGLVGYVVLERRLNGPSFGNRVDLALNEALCLGHRLFLV